MPQLHPELTLSILPPGNEHPEPLPDPLALLLSDLYRGVVFNLHGTNR